MCLLICEFLLDDRLLRADDSEYRLDPSEDIMLPAEANEALESPESISCSGIASESLLDVSEDHKLVTLALESIDLCPIISYLLEEVENEDMLVTDGRLSLPTSMEESRDTPAEYLEDTYEGRLSVVLVKDDTSSLGGSGSGEGD